MTQTLRCILAILTVMLLLFTAACACAEQVHDDGASLITESEQELVEIEDETVPLAAGEQENSLRSMVLHTLPLAVLIALFVILTTLLQDSAVIKDLFGRLKGMIRRS